MRAGGWDPFEDMARLRERINSLFEETISRAPKTEPVSQRTWSPAVDISETPEHVLVQVDLAGVPRDKVDIEIEGETLTIKGTRPEDDSLHYLRVERPKGEFRRSFTIGVPVERGQVKAAVRDGVLEIVLPKVQKATPEQVKVSVE
jgi:HSP20 family protein